MKNQKKHMALLFRYCRTKRRVSQRTMALLLKVNQSTICRIEKGVFYPKRKICKQLERVMKVPFEKLLRDAINASNLLENVEGARGNVNELCETRFKRESLSADEVNYLQAKYQTLAWETGLKIKRKALKVRRKISQQETQTQEMRQLEIAMRHNRQLLVYFQYHPVEPEILAVSKGSYDMLMILLDGQKSKVETTQATILAQEMRMRTMTETLSFYRSMC